MKTENFNFRKNTKKFLKLTYFPCPQSDSDCQFESSFSAAFDVQHVRTCRYLSAYRLLQLA
jgi:hypothetical protein